MGLYIVARILTEISITQIVKERRLKEEIKRRAGIKEPKRKRKP